MMKTVICHSLSFLSFAVCLAVFGFVTAEDPFQTLFIDGCNPPRQIRGCTETLLDAFKKTGAYKEGDSMNEPTTSFYLYTRRNENPEYLHECGGRLPKNTKYRAGKGTVIVVPGYLSSVCDMAIFREIKDQLLVRDNYNVLLVDWKWGHGIDHYSASVNSKILGRQMSFLIQNIMKKTGENGTHFHIVGHSLGAHAAGYAGHYLQAESGVQIRIITGLDPSGPHFMQAPPNERLDKADASTVHIIHSNAGDCLDTGFGYPGQMGHADMYPNGGVIQLGCYSYILPSILKFDIYYALLSMVLYFCHHLYSLQLFKESINPGTCLFVGIECASYGDFKSGKCGKCVANSQNCAVMGMDFENFPRKPGEHSYYLDTNLQCPSCKDDAEYLGDFKMDPPPGDELHCFPPN